MMVSCIFSCLTWACHLHNPLIWLSDITDTQIQVSALRVVYINNTFVLPQWQATEIIYKDWAEHWWWKLSRHPFFTLSNFATNLWLQSTCSAKWLQFPTDSVFVQFKLLMEYGLIPQQSINLLVLQHYREQNSCFLITFNFQLSAPRKLQ